MGFGETDFRNSGFGDLKFGELKFGEMEFGDLVSTSKLVVTFSSPESLRKMSSEANRICSCMSSHKQKTDKTCLLFSAEAICLNSRVSCALSHCLIFFDYLSLKTREIAQ